MCIKTKLSKGEMFMNKSLITVLEYAARKISVTPEYLHKTLIDGLVEAKRGKSEDITDEKMEKLIEKLAEFDPDQSITISKKDVASMLNISDFFVFGWCVRHKELNFPAYDNSSEFSNRRSYIIDYDKLLIWLDTKIGKYKLCWAKTYDEITQGKKDDFYDEAEKRFLFKLLDKCYTIEDIHNKVLDKLNVFKRRKRDGIPTRYNRKIDNDYIIKRLILVNSRLLDIHTGHKTGMDSKKAYKLSVELMKIIDKIQNETE